MKKSVIRVITISLGILLFLIILGSEMLNQYSLWQEFGNLKYTSFFEMLSERCFGALVVSLIIGITPIIVGEIIILINKTQKK